MSKSSKENVKRLGDRISVAVANHYANVACPLFTYQQEIPEAVKKLRKG